MKGALVWWCAKGAAWHGRSRAEEVAVWFAKGAARHGRLLKNLPGMTVWCAEEAAGYGRVMC